jgi:FkbM family methyltransferase
MMPLISICDHTFFSQTLGPESVIIDAGANVGDFSRGCASRFGCTPYAIEPNPVSAAQITGAHVFVHALGADTLNGELFINSNSEACSLLPHREHKNSITVPIIALHDFLAEQHLESVDLLKLDIERAELELLSTFTDIAKLAQISVEFHDFMFPEQRKQVTQTIHLMRSKGFQCFNFSSPRRGDVLFVNPNLLPLPLPMIVRSYARMVARHCRRQLHLV